MNQFNALKTLIKMERKKVAIIGVGLIGGSFALQLIEKGFSSRIIGVDSNAENAKKALELGLVDEIQSLEYAVDNADVIILSIPVDKVVELISQIMDRITNQILLDVGSTKQALFDAIKNHPKKGRLVATHPMWGTEYSGPEAAVKSAFENKAVVFCNQDEADNDAMEWVKNVYLKIGMHIIQMNAKDHDIHTAYISHISHITSFALANTVLEKEKEDNTIFELASGGFESTVRLAKSNPEMWVPVFRQNRENVLDVLNEHISQLKKFKSCLEKENYDYLYELIERANTISKIIK